MRRLTYTLVLVGIMVFALFARHLVTALSVSPSQASGLVTTAQVEFHGQVSQVLEERGLLAVNGVAQLSNITAEHSAPLDVALLNEVGFGKQQPREAILDALGTDEQLELKADADAAASMVALLSAQQWRASALIPFRRDVNGAIQLAGQGQISIRVVKADGSMMTLVGSLSNMQATLNVYDRYIGVLIAGTVTASPSSSGGSIDDYDGTIISDLETELELTMPWGPEEFLKTIEAMETQFPVTNTPDVPAPATSQPTVAGPGV